MDTFIMVAQLLLALSLMVGLHEMGHLLAAKAFGMRVEKFSIGFPPKIIGFTYKDTEYMLGAIPLGGYVKITGMIDESLDKEQMNQPPQPYEFRSKPAWQRLIVMLGGIFMNVLTGILVFAGIAYINGESYIPASELKNGVYASELAQEIGFKTGDNIVAINGKPFERFEDIYSADVILGNQSYYDVKRGAEQVKIDVPADFIEKLEDQEKRKMFVEPVASFSVGMVQSGTGADKAGLQEGDRITAVADQSITYFHELRDALNERKGTTSTIEITRNGEAQTVDAEISEDGKLGFRPKLDLEPAYEKYSLLQSVPKGTELAFSVIGTQISAFGKMFKGDISPTKSLSGPIGIAKQFGTTWDWGRFWSLIGLLSMVLAFMNLLPIPALDGGHVVFLSYEMISGRRPSDKFLENAQKVGMILLLGLMVFAFFNDIFKEIF